MKARINPNDFWAKLTRDEEGKILEWHPLTAHCADVAAVFEALLSSTVLGKRLAALLGWKELSPAHIARLSVLAAIHDAGKVNNGFQKKAFSPKESGAGHVKPLIDILANQRVELLVDALPISEIVDWFGGCESAVFEMLLSTWSHHGQPVHSHQPFVDETLWQPDRAGREPLQGLKELGECLPIWFPKTFHSKAPSFPTSSAFQHGFNGVLTLADWLGSDQNFFPFAPEGFEPHTYIHEARKQARKAIEKTELAPLARADLGSEPLSFARLSEYPPYDLQKTCMELPTPEGGSLIILESDTGSGKTEAALARFLRLYQAGEVDGIYFAVPTRAAATQLHRRVKEAMERAFSSPPPTVLAVPGYLRVDEKDGYRLPNFQVRWPDDEDRKAEHRGWAAQSPKRFLAAPIAVGTIDQVLLSSLTVSHAHMRAASLLRNLLVVDEVHASDAYMTRTLERVLNHHLRAGGHALLMSATLGSHARHNLSNVATGPGTPPPSFPEAVETAYPLITNVSGNDSQQFTPASSGYNKSIYLNSDPIAEDPEAIADLAIAHAEAGARVLIIRNRVQDCIETQLAIEQRARPEQLFRLQGIATPHHSRFSPGTRRRLDRQIEAIFGRGSRHHSVIAVATQTVEQSLDIDADILLTDLAPIDVLLQRLGRLHRHENRSRPTGYEQPQALILLPSSRDLGEHISLKGDNAGQAFGPSGLGTVYSDLRVLEATWRLLESQDEPLCWHIPADNRRLVESGTHPELLEKIITELAENWPLHQRWITGTWLADRFQSNFVALDWNKPFSECAFPKDTGPIRSRLGAEDYEVSFPEALTDPFGESLQSLNLPHFWLKGVSREALQATVLSATNQVLEFEVQGQRFLYDRLGIRRSDSLLQNQGEPS